MGKLIANIFSATMGIWLAAMLVPEVSVQVFDYSNLFGFPLTNSWQVYIILGVTLGLINRYVKPILNFFTFPFRMVTLGIFGILVNIGLIWTIGYIFREFSAPWFWPLLWTSIIVYGLNQLVFHYVIKEQ